MKRIAFFCIPAHGHTNPMVAVAAELVRRGNAVRFYSFREFREKIESAGAEFVGLDSFLPELTAQEEQDLKQVRISEMTVQDIRITAALTDLLAEEFQRFQPDVIYSDSACFWGKLSAWKFGVPLVVSTSTFAFNRMSSQYMKHSPAEMADLIFGLPKISRAMKQLEPLGYPHKNALELVSSDNDTDSVVYTSRGFQPYAASFSDRYLFMGPSLRTELEPDKEKARPLIYISMGTVINDRPDLYRNCIEALRDLDADVIISCGKTVDIASFGTLPEHIRIFPSVDQLEVLSRADLFLTHCGMNSVSESLYMAAPMLLYPQTGEQQAVARRVHEIGAGAYLRDDSAAGIRSAVTALLGDRQYADAARRCCDELRACCGTAGAAAFIENAPHPSSAPDPLKELARMDLPFTLLTRILPVVAVIAGGIAGIKGLWIFGIAAGILAAPFDKVVSRINYRRFAGRD